jgi:uncharacterized protein (DUF2267 family)
MLIPIVAAWAGAAGAQAEPRASDQGTIVVTGRRIQDYRARLRACLERNCPPDEDADATLALAEALFLEGGYSEARQAVRGSLDRNRRHVRAYPEPVADLFRAHARLSRHLGIDDDAARSTRAILASLKEGIPQEDHRHFTARLELSELLMAMGHHLAAKRELGRLADLARAAGRNDVAAMAELRTIWFDYVVDQHGSAKKRLAAIAAETAPERRMEAIGAKILLSRIHRAEGEEERADALIAEIGRGASTRRRLIHSPTYQLAGQEPRFGAVEELKEAVAYGNTLKRAPLNFKDKWVDVGFWVLPDGKVSGLEIVRKGASTEWVAPLLKAIRGRVYSTAPDSTYRLERYTYTADVETASGTRIRQHSPRARVEYLDLTTVEGAGAPKRM